MIRARTRLSTRLVAGLAALAFFSSASESLVGELRDGAIHHESTLTAASHHDQSGLRTDHGHEDGGAPAHGHSSQHQHGTSADHCTHTHGVGVTATFQWDCAAPTMALAFRNSDTSSEFFSTVPLEPPRA